MALAPGEFCWCEVATPDVVRARDFYAPLFGWDDREEDVGGAGRYTFFSRGGRYAAGAVHLGAAQRRAGLEAHWLCYLLSNHVEGTAARVAALGGRLVMAPTPVPDMGLFAVIADPGGAVFALWQGEDGPEAWPRSDGFPCWFELNTADAAVAGFYQGLLGWRAETRRYDRDYTVFFLGDKAVASIAVSDAPAPPDHWLPYFAVPDCAATAARAVARGGTVTTPCTFVAGLGSYASLADPAGARFAIKQNL